MKNWHKRRKSKIGERAIPCQCCGHIISHRHHLLPFATWGENPHTVQLCANCHEMYHLFYEGAKQEKAGKMRSRSVRIAHHLMATATDGGARNAYLINLVIESLELEKVIEAEWQRQSRNMKFFFDTFFGGGDGDE